MIRGRKRRGGDEETEEEWGEAALRGWEEERGGDEEREEEGRRILLWNRTQLKTIMGTKSDWRQK